MGLRFLLRQLLDSNKRYIDLSGADVLALEILANGDADQRQIHKVLITLLLNDNFKPFVKRTRLKLKIPKDGYILKNDADIDRACSRFNRKRSVVGEPFREDQIYLGDVVDQAVKTYISEEGLEHKLQTISTITKNNLGIIINEYIVLNAFVRLGFKVGTIEVATQENGEKMIQVNFSPGSTLNAKIEFLKFYDSDIKSLESDINGSSRSERNKAYKLFSRDVGIYNAYNHAVSSGMSSLDAELKIAHQMKISDGTVRSSLQKIEDLMRKANG